MFNPPETLASSNTGVILSQKKLILGGSGVALDGHAAYTTGMHEAPASDRQKFLTKCIGFVYYCKIFFEGR
jgi:hypothetical protein